MRVHLQQINRQIYWANETMQKANAVISEDFAKFYT